MTDGPKVELFAVQARLSIDQFASEEAFAQTQEKLAERISALRARDFAGRPLHPALAVWPEVVAAPLGLMGYVEAARECRTTHQAMAKVALRRIGRVLMGLRHLPRSPEEALFVAAAPEVHRAYFRTFSGIARRHQLWVVAGSALLPENRLGAGSEEFQPASARTYNVSYTFAPDGRCVAATRKVNLVPTLEDALRLTPGRAGSLPAVDTPFGRLGTLICYDGFRIAHTEGEPCFASGPPLMDKLGVQIIAQPSANPWPWRGPWVFNEPGERQLRCEQWYSEGLCSSMRSLSHVRYAVNPQLVGEVLDNHFEGLSVILERRPSGEVVKLAEAADPNGEEIISATVAAPIGETPTALS